MFSKHTPNKQTSDVKSDNSYSKTLFGIVSKKDDESNSLFSKKGTENSLPFSTLPTSTVSPFNIQPTSNSDQLAYTKSAGVKFSLGNWNTAASSDNTTLDADGTQNPEFSKILSHINNLETRIKQLELHSGESKRREDALKVKFSKFLAETEEKFDYVYCYCKCTRIYKPKVS